MTDTIQVADSLGNVATRFVTVTVGVGISGTASTAPKASRTLTATGGSGTGYVWSITTNNSGGSIGAATGIYTAGSTGGVTDTVQVTDSLSNSSAATITVTAGTSISPATVSLAPKASQTLTASGGSGTGYAWSITTNNSGGSIGAGTGVYTAGATGGAIDTVQVTDSLGNVANRNVTVTAGVGINGNASTVPKASRTLTATGGSGTGYAWSITTNNSGGTIGAGTGVYTAGSTGSVTDTVRVTDSLGNTATATLSISAGVSISPTTLSLPPRASQALTASGGSGTGYIWSVNNVSHASINPTTGLYTAGTNGHVTDTVLVTDSLGNTATLSISVTEGPATHFRITGLPVRATSGVSGTISAEAFDQDNNPVTGYLGTVHVTSTDPLAILPPDATFQPAENGFHTFVFPTTLKTAGTQSITVTDTVANSISGTQSLPVDAAGASYLVVSGFANPTTTNVGHAITVTARDAAGNVAIGYLGTVHVTSSDALATLPGDYAFQASDAGVKTLSATLKTLGAQSITVTDKVSASIAGSQTGITVNPVPPVTPVVTLDANVTTGATGLTASTQDQGAGMTYTWSFTNGNYTGAQGSRQMTYTAGSTGTLTASVTVSNAGGNASGSASATVVAMPTISGFSVSPTSVTAGNAATLSYTFTGTSAKIGTSAGASDVAASVTSGGTTNVAPGSTTTYHLTVANAANTTIPATATLTVYPPVTISGNAGVAGATLSYTDGTAKTATADGTGAYSFTVSYNWSGTVTPAKVGYAFTPVNRAYTALTSDSTTQDYLAAPAPASLNITISGLPGSVDGGVRIYGPSSYSHATTGTESLTGLAPGDYTIAPSGVWGSGAQTGNVFQASGGTVATLTAGATANVTISYTLVPSLTIQIPDASTPGTFVPMEFVRIPAGTYTMGSDAVADNWTAGVSQPTHTVTISKPFYLSKTKVTQAQWRAVMNANPSTYTGDNLPVDQVSWDDIRTNFLPALNLLAPGGISNFSLPSESQWEYACRAGTATAYSFGDDVTLLPNYAWDNDVSGSTNHAVGTKLPNPWGLFDMHGNAWEWCEDDFHWNYSGAPSDGSPWVDSTRSSVRVVRAGGWIYGAAGMRSAYRQRDTSSLGYSGRSFRLVIPEVGWVLENSGGPSAGGIAAYDSNRNVAVMFACVGSYPNDTWEYNGTAWRQVNVPGPHGRDASGKMVYDSFNNKMIMQGGWWPDDNDPWTWEYRVTGPGPDDRQWVNIVPTDCAYRGANAMAYDSNRHLILDFGGNHYQSFYNDTWRFDGSTNTWNWLQNWGPSRFAAGLVYDSSRDKFVMFGGTGRWWSGDTEQGRGNTCEFDPATLTWTEVLPQGAPGVPGPRWFPSMVYDAASGVTVMKGGGRPSDGYSYTDTWEWNGSAWKEIANIPGQPTAGVMWFDTARQKLVLFSAPNTYVYYR